MKVKGGGGVRGGVGEGRYFYVLYIQFYKYIKFLGSNLIQLLNRYCLMVCNFAILGYKTTYPPDFRTQKDKTFHMKKMLFSSRF